MAVERLSQRPRRILAWLLAKEPRTLRHVAAAGLLEEIDAYGEKRYRLAPAYR